MVTMKQLLILRSLLCVDDAAASAVHSGCMFVAPWQSCGCEMDVVLWHLLVVIAIILGGGAAHGLIQLCISKYALEESRGKDCSGGAAADDMTAKT